MPWLKVRLREVKKTPAGLATHLGIAPPRVNDHVVVFLGDPKQQRCPVMVRQLVEVTDAGYRLRQHYPKPDIKLVPGKKIAAMHRVITFDDWMK